VRVPTQVRGEVPEGRVNGGHMECGCGVIEISYF